MGALFRSYSAAIRAVKTISELRKISRKLIIAFVLAVPLQPSFRVFHEWSSKLSDRRQGCLSKSWGWDHRTDQQSHDRPQCPEVLPPQVQSKQPQSFSPVQTCRHGQPTPTGQA